MMNNKALRLPIILLALIMMGGVIQFFRPHKKLEAKPFRDPSSVETFEASEAGSNITINGHKASELTTTTSSYKPLSLNQPQSWNVTDIQRIEGKGSSSVLVFSDGSTRDVNPSIYKQLPSAIQTRISYERPN
jgi:hypothetical protein